MQEPHSVVLIGIDTLRPDFLSCYGFPHPSSPTIDRLASEGVLFTNAVSAAPWTLPAFASILSGQYPSSHGAGKRLEPEDLDPESPKAPILDRVPTLPQLLKKGAGFESAFFFDNPFLSPRWGLPRGFDTARRSGGGGKESVERALEWIRSHRDRRTFVMLHLMEPHRPYKPPEPYASWARKWVNRDGGSAGSPPRVTRERGRYAGEVAYTDHLVRTFVHGLADLGLLDQVLLIVTSDHGEEFQEHVEIETRFYNDPHKIKGFGHGQSQFQELLSVPLILRFPGHEPAGVRIDSLVQTLDLAPFILEWEGLEIPPEMAGISLLPALRGHPARRYAFSEFIYYGDERKSYREGDWKLILGPKPEGGELYDLASDPGERVDLKNRRPQRYRRLARRLLTTELHAARLGDREGGDADPAAIDEEMRKELHALGYAK